MQFFFIAVKKRNFLITMRTFFFFFEINIQSVPYGTIGICDISI